MPVTKKQSSLMAILAVCALFVVLLSFLLPYVSVNFFGTHTMSGVDFIVEAIEDEELPAMLAMICPVLGVVGLICAFAAIKTNKASVGTIISSGIGMIVMIVSMSDNDWDIIVALDYAAAGFYLYEVMSFAAIILSAASMYMSKGTIPGRDDPIPAPKPEPKPAPKPAPMTKKICPKCKKEQDKDAAFCRFCGTPLSGSKPTPPTPEPAPKPTPKPIPNADQTKKKGKVICPHCGARHIEGTTKCKYCGTSFDGSESVPPKPEPVPHPNPMPTPTPNPTPLKKDGKVICPHCGARQKEDAIKCKYCGTPIR